MDLHRFKWPSKSSVDPPVVVGVNTNDCKPEAETKSEGYGFRRTAFGDVLVPPAEAVGF